MYSVIISYNAPETFDYSNNRVQMSCYTLDDLQNKEYTSKK